MSQAAAQQAPEQLLLHWSAEEGQWSGSIEDGPFRLQITAKRQSVGRWRAVLRDLAGQAEMMRETLELELPAATEEQAIVEKLQELGHSWKQDPSLVFTGWGRP